MKITIVNMPVEDLRLDEDNPRLPENLSPRTQKALLKWMANEYNTVEVARSISLHGFFASEPLIAVKSGKQYTVVEGNRRLTALKLLLDGPLRRSLKLDEEREWAELATNAELQNSFPVHVARDRQEVAPIIGYRHIAGIEPWEPWAKARFIASQLEDEGQSFERVAAIVGEDESDVRTEYRNYRVAVDAESKLKVSATRVKSQFGTFTRAMNSGGLRVHIGAPAPTQVSAKKPVLKTEKKKEVAELFSWLFGDEENEPAIKDSRQISSLGEVVAMPDALRALRKTRNLDEALLMSGGVRARLLRQLRSAAASLERTELDIESYRDDTEVQSMLEELSQRLNKLRGD